MRLHAAAAPVYGRHETFHLRHGWARKAVESTEQDFGAFRRDDAMLRLGVGRNMVRSIRFWGEAAGLISPSERPGGHAPTEFGRTLFGDGGLDPWSESDATPWLLHWRLLSPSRCMLPVWWTALCSHKGVALSAESLADTAAKEIAASGWDSPAESSIRKDVRVFLRSYGAGRTRYLEDEADSVLRDLGVLRRPAEAPGRPSGREDSGTWRLDPTYGMRCPPWALCHMLADWADLTGAGAVSSADRICNEPGSPAQILRLSPEGLVDILEAPGGPAESEAIRADRSIGGGVLLTWLWETAEAVQESVIRCYRR